MCLGDISAPPDEKVSRLNMTIVSVIDLSFNPS